MVVWRSVGLMRTAMAAMVREPGTIGSCLPGRPIRTVSRGSRCSTGRRRWRRCRVCRRALGGRAEIWIKREDLLPLAFGGNKLRSLEYLVGAALAEGADCLVTTGRRWSNHARLTAAAGARAGLPVHLVLSGPPTDPPNPAIGLDELLGATIHQAATADRAERTALLERVVADLRAAGGRPSVIATGGGRSSGPSARSRPALELVAQADATATSPSTPSSSPRPPAAPTPGCWSACGRPDRPRSSGASRCTPVEELRPAIARLVAGLGDVPGLAAVDDAEIVLDESQLGEGYGRRTEAADEATRLLARTEGILVDPIYTAKALAGLVAEVRSGRLDGKRAVFWHAGGTPGLFEPLGPLGAQRHSPADRHASRIFIRPPTCRTAPE